MTNRDKPKGETGRRVGYTGVYCVENTRIEDGRLRFQYVANLESKPFRALVDSRLFGSDTLQQTSK